jgi:hypothetical protein
VTLGPSERVAVPFSKVMHIGTLVVLSAFVMAFAYLALHPDGHGPRYSPTYVRIVSIVGLPFFGAFSIICIARIFDAKPGLIIDRQGIDDRTHVTGVGRVDWADVRGLRPIKVGRVRFLVVDVHEPARFARRGNIVQRLLRMGSRHGPVVLASLPLDVQFDTMVELVRRFYEDAKPDIKLPLSEAGRAV